MKALCKLFSDERGGEVLEYALIMGLIVVAAMEATTIRPMIRAYSRTSPPRSSENSLHSAFMTRLLFPKQRVGRAVPAKAPPGLYPRHRREKRVGLRARRNNLE